VLRVNASADDLLELLGSDLNRRILALTCDEMRSADAIADRCEASLPTVYRHIDDLRSVGVLDDRIEYDAQGNHFKTYTAALDSFTVTLTDGELHLSVESGPGSDDGDRSPNVERMD
jgi:DNA-binding transcriptional ArsR family regulator